MWIAKKPQTIKREGKNVKVDIGDPIPEAATWPNPQTWVRAGYIKWINCEIPEIPSVSTEEVPPKKAPVSVETKVEFVEDADEDTKPGKSKKKKAKVKAPASEVS